MLKICMLLCIIFPSVLHGADPPDHSPILSWHLFPDGVQAIDGSNVVIVANGLNVKISLNGSWPEGMQGKQLLDNLIAGKRTELRIYGKDDRCQNAAVLFAAGVNINKVMIDHGFKQNHFLAPKECIAHAITIKNFPSSRIGLVGGRYPVAASSSRSASDTSHRTQHVSGYMKKNGTYVQPYKRSPRGTLSKQRK